MQTKHLKYLLSIGICSLILLVKPMTANADMFMNGSSNIGGFDFNMDMIMDQGNMSMDGGYDAMDDANETNFMNHQMDNTMDFFFDNMSSYNNEISMPDLSTTNTLENAFEDGLWSSSFNDHFNNDVGMVFPEVSFENGNGGGSIDTMPYNNSEGSNDVVDAIDNNTMPEEVNKDNNNSSNDKSNNDETGIMNGDIVSSNDVVTPDNSTNDTSSSNGDNGLNLDNNTMNNDNLDNNNHETPNLDNPGVDLPNPNDPNENNGLNHPQGDDAINNMPEHNTPIDTNDNSNNTQDNNSNNIFENLFG